MCFIVGFSFFAYLYILIYSESEEPCFRDSSPREPRRGKCHIQVSIKKQSMKKCMILFVALGTVLT